MDCFNEEENRIDKNMPVAELGINETKSCEFKEVEACPKNDKQVLHDSSITSPVKQQKRKSELTVKDEIKRKRDTDYRRKEFDDENLIDNSNIRDTALKACYSEKCEKYLISSVEFPGNIKKTNKVQHIILNQSDESAINREKNTDATDGTIQAPMNMNKNIYFGNSFTDNKNEPSYAKNSIMRQDMFAEETLNNNHSSPAAVHIPSITLKKITDMESKNAVFDNVKTKEMIINQQTAFIDESAFENRLICCEDLATGNLSISEELPRKNKSNLLDKAENKMVKSPNRVINREMGLSYNVSLQMNRGGTDTNKSRTESNKSELSDIIKSCEYIQSRTEIREQENNMSSALLKIESHLRRISKSPYGIPENLGSIPEFNSNNSIYEEPAEEFISSEYFGTNPDFLRTQQQLLESLSQEQCSDEYMKSQNDDIADEMQILPEVISETDIEYSIHQKTALQMTIKFMKNKGNALGKTLKELNSQLEEFAENIGNVSCSKTNYPEFEKPSAAAKINVEEKSAQEILGNSSKAIYPGVLENQNSAGTSSIIKTFSNSKTFQLIPEEVKAENHGIGGSLKNDYPKFKEYPGLAEEPTKVKKDARYQKRFYKKNPVILPIDWAIDRDSNNESETNIDHEEDQTQRTEDSPKNNENLAPLVTCEKRRESNGDDRPETSNEDMHDTDGYKVSSLMKKHPSYSSPSDSTKILSSLANVTPSNAEISFPPAGSSRNIFENDFKVIRWAIVKFNIDNISDQRAIFIRDVTSISPLDNSVIRPFPLRPFLKIICYAGDRNEEEEFSIEEFLSILLRLRGDFLSLHPTNDPQLEQRSFEIPLFKIPIRTNSSFVVDNDYELVGDYLMRIV